MCNVSRSKKAKYKMVDINKNLGYIPSFAALVPIKVANKDITTMGMIGESPFVYIKEGVIPEKWESSWDSMGSFSPSVRSYGRMAYASKPGNHSQSLHRSTTYTNGFPMV
jgi:hypothetical protein